METEPGGSMQSSGPMSSQEMDQKVSKMQDHIDDLLNRITKSNQEVDSLATTLKSRETALAQEQQEKLQMNQRLALMEQQLAKSVAEKEHLQAKTGELSQQVADAIRARVAVVLQLDECVAREESIANSRKLQAHELEALRSSKKNLEEQLLRLEAELSSLQCGTKEAQLEAKVQQMQFELQSSDEAVSGLKSLLVQEQARVQVLIEQLNAAQASEKAMQEFHTREVEAQARAVQLYQDESKEARAIAEVLEKKLSEMQSMLHEASQSRQELERKLDLERAEWINQMELKDRSIETLKMELSEAKTLLEQTKQDAIETYMEQMFPGAATFGRLLPPDLTFSKIFMEYSNATKQLDGVKDERDQLNLKLSFLTSELTERENEVAACKAALQEAQQESQKLQVEKRHLAHECQEAKCITQEAVRSATQHAKDKARLQTQVRDLSAQVVRLLEAGEAKADAAPSVSPDAVSNMVLFRDVSELQHRNVELLAALRDMQQRAEQAENAVSNSQELGELQARLEEARNEVRRLQNSSLSQEHLIEILVKQRDHFEKLSKKPEMKDMAVTTVAMVEKSQQQQQQQQQQPARQAMSGQPTGVPPIVMELRGRLRKAEEALANVNKDYDLFRQDSRNQFTMVTEQLEAMRTSLSESKLAQANLRAESESGKERLANARANIAALTSQLEGMRSMRQIQDKTIERHERSLVELHKELVNTHTTLAQNEELLARLQSELRRLRISEGVLRNENDSLKKSSSTQQMVLQSAQELRACILTEEAEQRLALAQSLDASEATNKQLKQTLEEVEARLAAEVAQLKGALEIERASLGQAKAETLRAESDVARLTERLAQAERDVLAMRAHRNAVIEAEVQTDLLGRDEQAAAEHLGALQQKVAVQTEELAAMRTEIAKERTRAQNAETQVAVYETSLKMSRSDVAQRNATIESTKAEVERLRGTVSTLESTLSEVRNEKNRLQNMFQNVRGELTRVQGLLQKQNQTPPRQQPGTVPVDTSALDAVQEELAQAREQIERLEMQHKQDLNAISTFRKQVVTANTTLQETKSKLEELTKAESLKEKHTPEPTENKAELLALKEENKALLDQVYAQGMELCALKQSPADTSGGELNTSGRSLKEEDAHTPEQMLQVLKHLRREREVATSRVESLEAKVKGLCVQLEASERQLREAREHVGNRSMQAGQLKGDTVELSAERYREISQKLETLNALTDSNIVQREKCGKLEQQVTSLQAELVALGNIKEEFAVCKADLNKATEKLKAQQEELVAVRGEASRWRSRVNQLTERANQANNQEIKRLQTEVSNLQHQLSVEQEELQKCRATLTDRDAEVARLKADVTRVNGELTKLNTELARVNSEVSRVSGELSAVQGQVKTLEEEKATLEATLTTKDTQLKDITNKELQVRRIAKKYKSQYEELLKSNEAEKATQQQAAAAAGPSQEVQEMTARLEELETRVRDAESRAVQAESTAAARQEEVNKAEAKVTELQHQVADKQRESASWEERSERMKSVLQTARQRIGEGNSNVNRLQQELNTTNANLESQRQATAEAEARLAALELRFEAQVARMEQQIQQLEQENSALQRNLSDSEQSAPQAAARQPIRYTQQQGAKSGATTTLTSDKSSGETPTANIRPMAGPSQIKLQQQGHQSATVPPTSRTAPMARLRPMSMGPRSMAVAPSQQQTATPSSSSSSSGTVAVAPMQGVQVAASTSEPSTSARQTAVTPREEAAVEPSTSQQENPAEEQNPVSAGATVVLVRPQEVQPAVSSSQSLQSVAAPPSTSRPPPTLKRSREEAVATRSEEPQVKHACMEVTSGNAEAVAVVAPSLQEEPSSSHGGQTFEAIVTSNVEPEREADAQEPEREPADTAAQDEDTPMENETSEVVDSDSQNEVLIIDEEEERDNGNQAEPSSSSGPSPSARHSELFRAVEALLDSGTASSAQSEPTSSSTVSLPRPPTLRAPQAHLVLPQQQGYEEIGDDSIVPSTPTLFVPRRREGFGEGVSSPQVPQSQGRLFTFAPESTPSPMSAPQVSASGGSESLEEARLEAADDPGTGRSVPSTPLLISPQDMVPSIAPSVESQPQETPEVTASVPSEIDVPSSSSVPVIMVTPAASQEQEGSRTLPDQAMQSEETEEQETVQQTVPSPSVRGMQNRGGTARRSPQQRGNNRPRAPIVWNENQEAQHPRGQGRGRMSPRLMRRGMMPRGGSPGTIPPLLGRGSPSGRRMGNGRPMRRPF